MKKVLFTLLAAAALAGCSKDDGVTEIADVATSSDMMVNFSVEGIATRITEILEGDNYVSAWEGSDRVGIFSTGFDTNYTNVEYAFEIDGPKTSAEIVCLSDEKAIYYPNNESGSVTFYAYHPYKESYDTTKGVTVSIAGQNKEDNINKVYDVDFVTASKTVSYAKGNTPSVALSFDHMLSRVILDIEHNNNIESLTGLKVYLCDVYDEKTYTLLAETPAFSPESNDSTADVELYTYVKNDGSEAKTTAIVFPGKYSAVSLKFELDEEFELGEESTTITRTFEVDFKPTLEAGYTYTYNVTLGNDIVEFGGDGSTITKWEYDSGNATTLEPKESTEE